MELTARLQKQIRDDLRKQQSLSLDEVVAMIEEGQAEEAADHLIFFSPPGAFAPSLQTIRRQLADRFSHASRVLRKRSISFLTHLTLDLSSLMVSWNLQDSHRHGGQALADAQILAEIRENLKVVAEWEDASPAIVEELVGEWKAQATARFVAEQCGQPGVLADDLVGNSVRHYLGNMAAAIRRSNLRRIAEMYIAGLNGTELGNDFATYLKYTMYLGVSFVTTNPVLVGMAWDADPAYWDPVMDDLVAANPGADQDDLARLATLEVVLANMRLLRPIFLLTEGHRGCVSLQVNPKKHGDASVMVADATDIYEDLTRRLDGGVPNVIFKLPATLGGLQACRALTKRGIGVNITVNCALFQQLRFAEAIAEGQSIFSTLTEINGRLAHPVRDELLGKLPELAPLGISEADAREAAAWAGVAVVKKLQRLLEEKGYDLQRVKPLVASLRVYRDRPGHDRLPSAYPDITEDLGTSIITVFPHVRRAFDQEPEMDLHPDQVHEPVPSHVLDVLAHSDIFKQTYYVADRNWVEVEDERFRPVRILTLEDEREVAAWSPVHATLRQFCSGYDEFVERLLSRRG